jgi:disulfide bond formation protein DsbB
MLVRYFTPYSVPIWACLLSAGLLIGAWIFQYGFGYAPCQMCYWQRHAHKAVLIAAGIGLIIRYVGKPDIRIINAVLMLALLTSAALAFWHMGVEYKWWEGPKTCLAEKVDLDAIGSGVDLLNSLNKPIKPPACADAVWHFLGLSMAGWNMVISAAGVIATAIFGFRPEKP